MSEPKIADRKPAVLELEVGTHYWCACGLSSKQPFCDGSHKGSGLSPIKFEISQPVTKALCQCKQSGSKPYCDGSHKQL